MTAKKLIVALALVLSATSASLAKVPHGMTSGAAAGVTSGYDPGADTQR